VAYLYLRSTIKYKVVCFEGGTATLKQLKPSQEIAGVFIFYAHSI